MDHPRKRRDGDGGGTQRDPRHGEHVLPASLPCKEQQRGHAGNGKGKQTFGEEGETSGDAGKRQPPSAHAADGCASAVQGAHGERNECGEWRIKERDCSNDERRQRGGLHHECQRSVLATAGDAHRHPCGHQCNHQRGEHTRQTDRERVLTEDGHACSGEPISERRLFVIDEARHAQCQPVARVNHLCRNDSVARFVRHDQWTNG